MSTATTRKKKLTLRGISPIGRVSFPRVFVPQAILNSDVKKYQITLSFVPDELDEAGKKAFKDMIDNANAVSKDGFGVGYKEPFEDENGETIVLRSPFRSGKTSKFFKDNEVFIRFSSTDKPEVIDALKEPITSEEDFYPGCLARVSYVAGWYLNMGNRGVTFYLGNIQKTGKGERLMGGPPAQEEFDAVDAGDGGSGPDGVDF